MLDDIRIALRSLLRTPAFTATTVLILALAAGANAAIFAIVYGILLKPLPFEDPATLVAVWPGRFQSTADLLYTREHGRMFSSVAAVAPGWTMSLTGTGEPVKVTVARVSGNLFETLRARPLYGRAFADEADRPGRDRVVVLDYRFWMKRFGGDPGVIGRSVHIDGDPVQIVAVMPRAFQVFGSKADAYTPLTVDPSAWHYRIATALYVARLAPGLTPSQASRDYKTLTQQLRRERNYSAPYGRDASVVDMRTALVGDTSHSLVVLASAVGLILLIAGANVGTLQMTRASSRARDLAVRFALGASRGRIVRQLLAENIIVAAAAGVLGVAMASAILPTVLALLPADTPRVHEIALDPFVSGAVLAAAMLVALSMGLPSALGVTRLRGSHLLRAAASSEARGTKRLRGSLVSAEIALAVVLTIGAGLMLRTLWQLQRVDPGFEPNGVLAMHAQPSGAKYRDVSMAEYYDRILERVRMLPGVTAAGAIQHLPFSGYSWSISFEAEGHTIPPGSAAPTAGTRIITPGYFAAIGQPLLAGRDIERADARRMDVALVNEALAAGYFGSAGAAVGRIIRLRSVQGTFTPLRIVGVAGNVHHSALTTAPGPEVYTSVSRHSINAMMLAVRTDGDPLSLLPAVREAVWSIDRDVPLSDIETMEAKIGRSLGRPRLLMTLLGAFAALGGLLAFVGVYGVASYSVAQRWRELGIMIALGADRGRIVKSVLREAVVYGMLGLALGIPCAVAGSRLLRSLVFGVSPTDAATYFAIACATIATVTAASIVPAVRAASVDPAGALKG